MWMMGHIMQSYFSEATGVKMEKNVNGIYE